MTSPRSTTLASAAPASPPSASLTLASASPRRSQLLAQIGVAHRVRAAEVDESPAPGEPPHAYVERLARAKAEACWAADDVLPALGADTAVVLDGEIYGKPRDGADAVRMLRALGGRTHAVLTAVALRHGAGLETALSASEVELRPLTLGECERYWATGEPADKAGGYAIQGLAAVFVTRLAGSYSGVMGLPLAETAQLLARAGVPLWQGRGP